MPRYIGISEKTARRLAERYPEEAAANGLSFLVERELRAALGMPEQGQGSQKRARPRKTSRKRARSVSLVRGLAVVEKEGRQDRRYWYVRAYGTVEGRSRPRWFSINNLGVRGALRDACHWRQSHAETGCDHPQVLFGMAVQALLADTAICERLRRAKFALPRQEST